ncbi:FAD-binding oxidoreductase [Dictyobacter aurantiacus]|uniref:FAD-linked oxidase n=1 Tax=Dictyobacter aurantiacus TaxID=1936993 RepID=A0A401ZJ13_9CHLR|nr:FAD-binding oxidoreductase [Dictyobacter aurantiacus]GCE06830.1 FAD-linked oxidase [Dictyobacter aurantiacus]
MVEIAPFVPAVQQQFPQTPMICDPGQLLDYAVDDRLPGLLIQPQTVEEAARIVRFLKEQHLRVLPRGNGTHMNTGDRPEHIDVLLETTAINRILEHEVPDLTCQVEAGITLGALQAALNARGQRLALDPPDGDATTIGGMLATNASGPKRLRYGTARDQLIGLRVIQANGEISRSGGKVVKNVAGYDLNKLYIGSFGTLGIIVEANFKLNPLPQAERTLLFTFARCEDAMRMTQALLKSPLAPSAIELIALHSPKDATPFFDFPIPEQGYTLAVDYENSTIAIARQIDETNKLAQTHQAFLCQDLEGHNQERFWQMVSLQMLSALTCKISVPITRVAATLRHVEETCQREQLVANIVAHAGNGILYVELGPHEADTHVVDAITELRRYAQTYKGSLVLERCPTRLKQRLSVWGEPRADFYLMQRLKQQFDPQGLFVTGRYVGGL